MTCPSRFMVLAELWIMPGQRDAFEAYERQALAVALEFGGRLETAVILNNTDGPDEVHVLSFPTREDFEQFRDDPRLADVAKARARCIARTKLTFGAPSALIGC